MVRSQIAEALYKKYRGGDVLSAGILPQVEQYNGKKLKDLNLGVWIQTLKNKEGINISLNICKQVTEKMVEDADMIIVMAKKEIWPDFLIMRKDVIIWDDVKDNGDIPKIIDQIKARVILL